MNIEWMPAWYGLRACGDGWEIKIHKDNTWKATCFQLMIASESETEEAAKADALTWVTDALREAPRRAAIARGLLQNKPPLLPFTLIGEHIERYEAMRAQFDSTPETLRKREAITWLEGAITALRMFKTLLEA